MHLKHVPGIELIADSLTKVLAGPELPRARKKLGMVDVSEMAEVEVYRGNQVTDEGPIIQVTKEEPTQEEMCDDSDR